MILACIWRFLDDFADALVGHAIAIWADEVAAS